MEYRVFDRFGWVRPEDVPLGLRVAQIFILLVFSGLFFLAAAILFSMSVNYDLTMFETTATVTRVDPEYCYFYNSAIAAKADAKYNTDWLTWMPFLPRPHRNYLAGYASLRCDDKEGTKRLLAQGWQPEWSDNMEIVTSVDIGEGRQTEARALVPWSLWQQLRPGATLKVWAPADLKTDQHPLAPVVQLEPRGISRATWFGSFALMFTGLLFAYFLREFRRLLAY